MLLFINIDNLVEFANRCTLNSITKSLFISVYAHARKKPAKCIPVFSKSNTLQLNKNHTVWVFFPSHLKIKRKVSFISWGIALFPTLAYNIQHSFNKQVHFLIKDSSGAMFFAVPPQNSADKMAQTKRHR